MNAHRISFIKKSLTLLYCVGKSTLLGITPSNNTYMAKYNLCVLDTHYFKQLKTYL